MTDHDLKQLNAGFYSELLRVLPCAVVLVDSEGRIIFFNSAAEELTGYHADEMLGIECEAVHTRLVRALTGESESAICPVSGLDPWDEECEIVRKDGSVVPVVRKSRPVTDADGHRVGGLQTMMDISFIREARDEISRLRQKVTGLEQFGRLVGSSPAMRKLFETITLVAATDASVVIEGETGTGKELIAREIHENSSRVSGNWVAVNCGALPESLVEAELFGHVRGAFTGAVADRTGCFEQASGGTLFLDEVGELALNAQVKLLRALQAGEITPVGESVVRKVDVRVVAATNRDLKAMVAAGEFREDLFYRLQVVKLHIAPLRERREDILALCTHFIERYNQRYDRAVLGCSPKTVAIMQGYDWPGNVRELEHAIEHAFVVMGRRELIEPQFLPTEITQSSRPAGPDIAAPAISIDSEMDEKQQVEAVLQRCSGNKSKTAAELGITRAGLYKKLRRLGIS